MQLETFDPHVHLHIGYYENGYDIEATAYKVENEDHWIIFLNADQKLEYIQQLQNKYNFYEYYGYKILTFNGRDLSYEQGCELLEKWLKDNQLLDDSIS